MASVVSTNESLPAILILPGYVFLNKLNAGVQRRRHGHTPNSNALLDPFVANEPHPLTTTTSRFAFASEEELSKLAEIVSQASPLHLRERVWYTSLSGFVFHTPRFSWGVNKV